jgi:hypothetical protein
VGEISAAWWARIAHSAAGNKMRRKILLEVDKEYAWELFLKQGGKCYFTNQPLKLCKGIANTASIDRIDNEQGYVKGNIRWVHKHINIMKNRYTDSYFVGLCRAVVAHADSEGATSSTGACPIR